MEDEQGAVGQGSGGGVSASPLSDNLPSESLVENMGSDNQVKESYEEGDGEEIMVEVVGSDVYVDGVSGQKEGHFDSGEVGDLEGHVAERTQESETHNFSEAMDVSSEGDGNKVGESDLGFSDVKHFVVTEEVDFSFSKSGDVEGNAVSALPSGGDDVIDDEVWNPGIEAMDGSLSAAGVPTENVMGPSPMVICEEKRIEDETVNKDSADLVTPEPFNHPAEAVFDEKADVGEKKEVLPSSDNSASLDHFSSAASVPSEEVTGPSPVVISDEKTTEAEAVTKDSADLVTTEPVNHPAEAVFDVKADTEETKEVLPSSDASATHGHFSSAASVPTEEVMWPSPVVISEEKTTEDEAVTKDSADLVTPEPLNHAAEAVFDEKADLAEKKEVFPTTNNSASHDDFGGDSVMPHGETKAADGGLEPAEVSVNPNYEGPQNIRVDGIDSVVGEVHLDNAGAGGELLDSSTGKDSSFRAEAGHASTGGDSGIEDKFVDEREAFAAENKEAFIEENKVSILKSDSAVSNVQDENQGCINEFHLVKLESSDQIDSVSHAGPASTHENSFVSERGEAVGNDERLKTGGDLETREAHENQVFSNEPNQWTDGGDPTIVDEDQCLSVDIQDGKEENEPNTRSLSCPSDKEIVQGDSELYSNQPLIATTLGAEIDDQDVVISQVKVVEGGESSENSEKTDSEIVKKSLECQGNTEIPAVDDFAENLRLPEEVACSEVQTADVMVTEDHVMSDTPVVNPEGFDNVVEECGSPQSVKQEVSVQTTETSNHEVDKFENVNLMPNEVANVGAVSDTTQVCILPERTENAELLVSSTNISLLGGGDIEEKPGRDMASSSNEVYKSMEANDKPRESNGFYIVEGRTAETKLMDVEEERESDQTDNGGQEVDAELGIEELSSEADKLKSSNEETVKYASSLRMNQSGYFAPPENQGHFAQSDLVWGKVRSHPWWPGQIFDPADASEKAVKYHKKDSYLVAYFGDQTFAWNDSSALKPFRSHFSQIEKQSNSEAFQNAVNCALEEVERRVELGLACSCIPKDDFLKIETQVVENTGIREESSRRYGVDQSSQASYFEPDQLLEYVAGLAPRASSRADLLDLVIARAQLSAFCCFKGYRSLTKFPSSGELLEIDADTEQKSDEMVALHKRRHIPKDVSQSTKKERSLMELMGDREYSPDAEDELVAEDHGKSVSLSSGKKRKALDPSADGSEKRVSVHAAKISTPASQTPKPSFKIGECIRRVASQLTGSTTSSVKGSNDETVIDGSPNIYEHSEKQSVVVSAESLSVNEMLSQLELVAQDPKKRHNIQNTIRAFFLGFRSSIALNRRGRKKKSEQTVGGSGEEFEFDDVNDSYWTDRIVQNYSEEQLLHDSENGTGNLQLVPFGGEKPVKAGRKPHSRKRVSGGISPTAATEVDENAKRRKQESFPAELILNFAERNCVPSEINLNKMFRRFGPLMESETEVDHESGYAKVIFKRGSDAEVARSSAEKFNIFGPVLVNYQIGYSPVISVKILPVAIPQPQEDATLML